MPTFSSPCEQGYPNRRRATRLEQLCDVRRGALRAVALDRPVGNVAADLRCNRVRDHVRGRLVEVHAAARAVPLQPVPYVEVLLEVVAEREVEKPPPVGR